MSKNKQSKKSQQPKKNESEVYVDGVVIEALPNAMFRVELDDTGIELLCVISGKIRQNYIRILEGDRVKVEISPYDLTRGRIVTRL